MIDLLQQLQIPVWPIPLLAVIVWGWTGIRLWAVYVNSSVLLGQLTEYGLMILCGPWVWFLTVRAIMHDRRAR